MSFTELAHLAAEEEELCLSVLAASEEGLAVLAAAEEEEELVVFSGANWECKGRLFWRGQNISHECVKFLFSPRNEYLRGPYITWQF